MKITKIRFYDIGELDSRFLAKCSIVLDDCIMVHDIKLLNGKGGKYIVMPERSQNNTKSIIKNNEEDDVFHPVRKSFFNYMKKVIFEGYDEYKAKGEKVYIPL